MQPPILNGGWAIGPHVISVESERGTAWIRGKYQRHEFSLPALCLNDNSRIAAKFGRYFLLGKGKMGRLRHPRRWLPLEDGHAVQKRRR